MVSIHRASIVIYLIIRVLYITFRFKRELTLLHYEVLAYLNDETGKPTLC